MNKPVGQSLFFLDYDLWRTSRNLINPLFSQNSLRSIQTLFKFSNEKFMQNIEKYSKNEQTFDIMHYFKCFILDNTLSVFFATQVDSANDLNNALLENTKKLFAKNISLEQVIVVLFPTFAKWLDFRFFDKEMTDFMTELIQNIINQRKQNNIINNDLLQVLLDSTDNSQETSKISELLVNTTARFR